MIQNDFKIDFENKKINYVGKSGKVYSARDFYSFLEDVFDEVENMKYDIPIEAKAKDRFKLINDWKIDKKSLKYINGKIN